MKEPSLLLAFSLGLSLAASPDARAADAAPFSAQALEQAQKMGRPILVAVHSSWCATCLRQVSVIDRIAGRDAFDKLLIPEVDFDPQKDVLRRLRSPLQSTLIAYRGRAEVRRLAGTSNADSVSMLMEKTLEEPSQ